MNRRARIVSLVGGLFGLACLGVHLFAQSNPDIDCIWEYQDIPSPQCSTSNNVYCTIRCTIPRCTNDKSTVYTGAEVLLIKQVEPAVGMESLGGAWLNCYTENKCRYGTNLGEVCDYSGSGIWVCDESDELTDLCHRCYPVAPTTIGLAYYAQLAECGLGG